MKKRSILSLCLLLVTAMTLSGCLFPFWVEDGGHGGHGGGHRDGGRGGGHDGHDGHRGGGDRH